MYCVLLLSTPLLYTHSIHIHSLHTHLYYTYPGISVRANSHSKHIDSEVICRLLLERGPSEMLTLKDKTGRTAADWAKRRGHGKLEVLLREMEKC